MMGRLAALNLPGIGSQSIRKGEAITGCFSENFSTWQEQICKVWLERYTGYDQKAAWHQAKSQAQAIKALGGQILGLGDDVYPEAFLALINPPILISALGDTSLLSQRGIAIVGSRRPSEGARMWSHESGMACAKASKVVVSGLALGCDASAHWGAIHGQGQTLAVLPSALTQVVPRRNVRLARRIVESGGALISEVFSETNPEPYQFVQRNRLVAALSEWIVVMEAGRESGTMHTVRMARKLDRKIGVMTYGHGKLSEGSQWILDQAWGVGLSGLESIL